MNDFSLVQPKPDRESFSDILAKIDPRSDGEKVGLGRFKEVCEQVEREYVDRGGAASFEEQHKANVGNGYAAIARSRAAFEWALKRRGELCAA